MGRKRRGECYVPSSPSSLVEDLAEIIQEEEVSDSVHSHKTIKRKENIPNTTTHDSDSHTLHPIKKARKSLVSSWGENIMPVNSSSNDINDKKSLPFETETPSKFLTSSGSIFSPSNIVKDTLVNETSLLFENTKYNECKKENKLTQNVGILRCRNGLQNLDPKWERLVCGQTKDQQYMVQQAHACLKSLSLVPRSLNFEKQK